MYYTTQGLCCYIHNYKTSTGHRTSWKHSWTSLRRTDQPMLEPKRGLHASPKRQHWATSRQFSDVSCLVFNYFGCFKKKLVRGKWNRFANFCIPKNFGAHAYARRTAPNKQASTFIFLYKLLFFFLTKAHVTCTYSWQCPLEFTTPRRRKQVSQIHWPQSPLARPVLLHLPMLVATTPEKPRRHVQQPVLNLRICC